MATHICCPPLRRYEPWTRAPGDLQPYVLGAVILCDIGAAPLSVPCVMQVPRLRQGVARLARLLPQDRPRLRHELDLEGHISTIYSATTSHWNGSGMGDPTWRDFERNGH